MQKFKRFPRFKHKTTDIDNVNVQGGGGPQATVGATAAIGEQLATPCQTPDTQYSIGIDDSGISAKAKLPFKLKLTKKQADELEKNIENSLELVLKPYFVKESGVDQMLVVRNKPTKSFMKKATNVPPQTDKHPIGTVISGDGTIGLSEEYEYPVGLHDKLTKHYDYHNNDDHHETLRAYTDDSEEVNKHLWNKHEVPYDNSHSRDMDHKVDKIDHAMSVHKTPHAMTVYSGMSYDPTKREDHNGQVHHPAYISASLDHEVAKGFAHQGGSGKHILAIHVPEGHAGAYLGHLSHVPEEREFALPHGLTLKRSHTDTQMGYSRIHKKPLPIHTHHMEIVK
jgi:ADP-ribosyltransferase exoenzyme